MAPRLGHHRIHGRQARPHNCAPVRLHELTGASVTQSDTTMPAGTKAYGQTCCGAAMAEPRLWFANERLLPSGLYRRLQDFTGSCNWCNQPLAGFHRRSGLGRHKTRPHPNPEGLFSISVSYRALDDEMTGSNRLFTSASATSASPSRECRHYTPRLSPGRREFGFTPESLHITEIKAHRPTNVLPSCEIDFVVSRNPMAFLKFP